MCGWVCVGGFAGDWLWGPQRTRALCGRAPPRELLRGLLRRGIFFFCDRAKNAEQRSSSGCTTAAGASSGTPGRSQGRLSLRAVHGDTSCRARRACGRGRACCSWLRRALFLAQVRAVLGSGARPPPVGHRVHRRRLQRKELQQLLDRPAAGAEPHSGKARHPCPHNPSRVKRDTHCPQNSTRVKRDTVAPEPPPPRITPWV